MNARALVVVLVLLGACAPPPEVAKVPRTVLVRSIPAEAAASEVRLYSGEVRARHELDLGFRIGGKLAERLVDVGAPVSAGQVLARLDPQDVLLASQAAAAQQSAVEAEVALARAEYERIEHLRARNFVSASALDVRRAALQAAEARLRQVRAQAAVAGNQSDYAVLRAPQQGVVTAAPAEVGQVLAAGQVVLRLAREAAREVLIHVPESRIAEIEVGREVSVRPWAQSQQVISARVREIAPSADSATRSFAVRVALEAGGEMPPLGATATVVFARPAVMQALLPLAAVTQAADRAVVWVVDEAHTLRRVEVEAEAFREDGVVIRGGLPAGARVVVAGVHRLVEGESVRAVDAAAPVALDARK